MKINRHGKAAIFETRDIQKIRKVFDVDAHRAIFEIALLTGERIGAIIRLGVSDVYTSDGRVRSFITFKKNTFSNRLNGSVIVAFSVTFFYAHILIIDLRNINAIPCQKI